MLLILVGVSIATLTGENGVLTKTSKSKEERLIAQYKEEINLIIIDEIAERKTGNKEELMIASLDTKIREKEWVNEIYKCNSSGEEQQTFEVSTHLLVESKEHYEFLIEVMEERQTAKIVSSKKGINEEITYDVQYNANDSDNDIKATNIPETQTKIAGKTLVLSSKRPTREGYEFQGWSTSDNGEVEYQPGDNYTEDVGTTLYAIYQKQRFYLYKDGNEFEDVTGGWKTKYNYGTEAPTWTNVNGALYSGKNIGLKSNGDMIETSRPINLSEYSSINVNMEIIATNYNTNSIYGAISLNNKPTTRLGEMVEYKMVDI